jgi:hypothetical protein
MWDYHGLLQEKKKKKKKKKKILAYSYDLRVLVWSR